MTVMASYTLRLSLLALAGGALLAALLLADRAPASGQSSTGFVSTSVVPAGAGTVTGGGRFAIGTAVTLTATANPGYRFDRWAEECSGSTPTCTITVGSPPGRAGLGHAARAHFVAVPPTPTPLPTVYTLTTTVNSDDATDSTRGGAIYVRRQGRLVSRVGGACSPPVAGNTCSRHDEGTVVILSVIADAGFALSSWGTSDSSCSGETCTVTMSADRSVTANFTRTHYVLTTAASPTGGGTVSGSGLFSATTSPAPSATVTATANTGYRFGSWSGACTGTSACTPTMDADKTVTANFIRTYDLTTSVSPAGAGTLDQASDTVDAGTAISITPTASLGYRFSEWSSDLGGCGQAPPPTPTPVPTATPTPTTTPTTTTTPTATPTPRRAIQSFYSGTCSFTIDRDIHVIAHFIATPIYTLTANVTPTGAGTVTGGGSYNRGSQATVTATRNTGYRFSHWTGACSGDGACTVSMTHNRQVVAVFVAQDNYYLLTGANPFAGGTVSGGGPHFDGSTVAVTATANDGWRFGRWTGDCSGSGTCSVVMTAFRMVTAHFVSTAATVELRARAQPLVGGTVSGGGAYAPGTIVTLVARATPGYTFEAWSGGCRGVSSTTCVLTVNYPRQVIARFRPPPPPAPAPAAPVLAPAPSGAGVSVLSRVRGEAPGDPAFLFHFTCTEAGTFALAPEEIRRFAITVGDTCTLRVTDEEGAIRVSGRLNAFPYTTEPLCVFVRDGDSGDLFTDRSFAPGDYTATVVFDYATPPEMVDVPLAGGITFIAWPDDSRSIEEAVGSLVAAVHYWDAAAQRWRSWFPGGDAFGINTLTTFRPGGVYAIARRAPFNDWRVEVSGSWEAPSVVRLALGANFVVWRGDAVPVAAALGDRIAAITAVYSWDAAAQRWLSWFPEGDDLGINTLTAFQPGSIYLISAGTALDWRMIEDDGAGEPPAC